MKPKILITARTQQNNRILFSNQNYFDAITKNGGIPFLYGYDDQNLEEVVEMFDGLLVTGGADIDASLYQQNNHPTNYLEKDYIDNIDCQLIKAFNKANKPILGICRGLQIINVVFGGSLIQDLNTCDRNIKMNYHHNNHLIKTTPNTELSSIYGISYQVNSSHHQAIDQLAYGFTITAISEDGIIEGIEKDNIVAVQFHPEKMIEDKNHNQIFINFIKKCL